jgi:hypothetical protein
LRAALAAKSDGGSMATTVRKGSDRPGAKKAIRKTAAAKKTPAKKAAPKNAAAKKAATKHAATKKAAARKTTAKKAPAKKAAAPKRAAAQKSAAKRPQKSAAKRPAKSAAKRPAARKAPREAPARRAARGITPAKALANTRRLLEEKQAHDREAPPWQALDGRHGHEPHAGGFQDAQARDRANELHAGESHLEAIQGAVGTRDRHNQGKRDQR